MFSKASYINNEHGDSPFFFFFFFFFGFWAKAGGGGWWASTSLRTTTFKGLFITLKFENDQLMQLCIVQGEGVLFLFDRSF